MSKSTEQFRRGTRPAETEVVRGETERRRRRREGLVIVACGLAVLLFALWEIRKPNAQAGAGGNVFSFLLVNLNIVLLLVLVFLVVRNVMKLFIERRRKVPGSQLRSRMVMAFIAIALFPAIVMLLVSIEFMTNTIDNWFNTEVEASLRGAWRLAQTHYRHSAEQAVVHAEALGAEVSRQGFRELVSSGRLNEVVAQQQRTYRLGTIQVFDREGRQIMALFNRDAPTGIKLGSDRELMTTAFSGETGSRVERFGESDIIRGAAPILSSEGSRVVGAVIVDYLVERSARLWSEEILDAFREYRQLKLNKRPFKNLYVLTLALASLVVVFSATWLGLYLARGIAEPLTQLSAATRRIAAGDWEVELPEKGGDEIGGLVRAFDSMTVQLKASHEALAEGRRYIENILANIDAGVISVDEDGAVTTVNPGAISLVGLRDGTLVGRDAHRLFADAGWPEVVTLLDDVRTGVAASGTRRSLVREEEARTLQVTATALDLPSGVRAGYLLFFEDVSQIVEVQRMEAWREVARRIAHEIKNPLTPIQLSAQRLRRRLRGQLAGGDAELFDDCTNTIVHEVDELKKLVNEFAHLARRPIADMRPQDLNQIVEETLPLFRQARPDLRIQFDGESALPSVLMNRDAVKRALVNLLDNAVAAVGAARSDVQPDSTATEPDITVRTRLDPELSRVVLEVGDHGPGIPVEQRGRVFEPYFSTKEDGTGLGLAIVASIAADHHAYVRLHENEPHGSRFVIEFPPAEAA